MRRQSDDAATAIVSEKIGDALVVRVYGELDFGSAEQLAEALPPPRRNGPPIVVDLTACRYLDTAVITTLVRAKRRAGAALRVVVPRDAQIRRIFELTELVDILRVELSLDDALR